VAFFVFFILLTFFFRPMMQIDTRRFCYIVWAVFAFQTAAAFTVTSRVSSRNIPRPSAPLFFSSRDDAKQTEESVLKKGVMDEELSSTSAWNDWLKTPTKNQQLLASDEEPPAFGLSHFLNSFTQPVQDFLDGSTSGWAMSYANLEPDSSQTAAGQAFLATNVAYLLTGIALQLHGEVGLGTLTEICSLASFQYHYQQLENTSNQSVRLALIVDYFAAALAMGTASIYLGGALLDSSMPLDMPILMAGGVTIASLGFLGLSWKYEKGRPYMVWHSLWHLASAYSGFLIGNLHATAGLLSQ
jgi:hypothetical protein